MSERLVHIRAADGLRLHGAHVIPDAPNSTCVIWVPGFGVNYDLPAYIGLGALLAEQGVAFISASGRGQSSAAVGWRSLEGRTSLVRTGSWYEDFEESALDIEAWVGHARGLGYTTVVLVGHSFGATKALYHLDRRPIEVDGLVLASTGVGLRNLEAKVAREAAAMVAQGRGEELLPPGSWPKGFGTDTVSAKTYASWWAAYPALFQQPLHDFEGIRCPVLAWYGTAGDVGNGADLDELAGRLTRSPAVETTMLEGLRHNCEGGESLMSTAIIDWLGRVVTPGGGA